MLKEYLFSMASSAMLVRSVETWKNRLKLTLCSLFTSLPRLVRRKFGGLVAGMIIEISGVKYVLVDADSAYTVLPSYEREVRDVLDPGNGKVFLDVGAHIGAYTLYVAKKAPECLVLAVEANPRNYSCLVRGITLNGLRNVIPVNIAAWNEDAKLNLYYGIEAGQNSLFPGKKVKYGRLGSVEVDAKPLDEVLNGLRLRRVDWIKIDVEDAEVQVLKGLAQTIAKHHPTLIIESFSYNLKRTIAFLEESCYNHKMIAPNCLLAQSLASG